MPLEERVHPIPFRTRQLSSPSSMILHILVWESRTVPRLYFEARQSGGLFFVSRMVGPWLLQHPRRPCPHPRSGTRSRNSGNALARTFSPLHPAFTAFLLPVHAPRAGHDLFFSPFLFSVERNFECVSTPGGPGLAFCRSLFRLFWSCFSRDSPYRKKREEAGVPEAGMRDHPDGGGPVCAHSLLGRPCMPEWLVPS